MIYVEMRGEMGYNYNKYVKNFTIRNTGLRSTKQSGYH